MDSGVQIVVGRLYPGSTTCEHPGCTKPACRIVQGRSIKEVFAETPSSWLCQQHANSTPGVTTLNIRDYGSFISLEPQSG